MITKLRNILGLTTLEENLARYNSVSEDIQYINSQTDDLSNHYYNKMTNYNHILKSEDYSNEIKKIVKERYDNFLQDQKKTVIGLVNKRHKLEKELSNLLKNDSLNKAVQELNSIEKAKDNYKSGKISKNVYNDIIKAKKGKVHYSDNFVFWNGKLLIIQRATDDTNANTWVLPGGHVDAGESHEDGAIRELQEETGLVVDNVVLAGTYSNDDVMIEYYTSHIDSDTEPQLTIDTSEHQSYKWIDIHKGELDKYEFPFNMKKNIKKILLTEKENTVKITKAINLFISGVISKEVLSDIVKARSGTYKNTPENRKLGRVGQKYGSKKEQPKAKDVSDPRGRMYNSLEYKLATKVQEILKERGINKSFSQSGTDFGNSMYFTVYHEDSNNVKLKVRISDHGVTNIDRMFGEQHENAKSNPVRIADNIEYAIYPERYDKIKIGNKYISKFDNRRLFPEKEDIDLKNNTVWTNEVIEEIGEKQLSDLESKDYIKIKDKQFLRESKSGKKVYKLRFKRRHSVDVEPIYERKRKENLKTEKIEKSLEDWFELGLISKDVFEKARTGKYADTAQNRRLKRVGQSYGTKKGEDTKETKEPSKQEETGNKEGKDIPIDQHARQSSETSLQEASKGGNEELRIAAKKELERREKEENVSDQPEKENVSVDMGKSPQDEKLPVSVDQMKERVKELRNKDTDDLNEIEKISKEINELIKKIKQSSEKERVDSGKGVGLSDDEIKSIIDYTGNDYKQINRQLRNKKVSPETQEIVNKISNGLSKLPDHKGKVFRGMAIPDDIDNMIEQWKKGGTVTMDAFTSTSTDKNVASKFGDFQMEIESKTGKDISKVSEFGKKESEILFNVNAKFQVKSLKVKKAKTPFGEKIISVIAVIKEV